MLAPKYAVWLPVLFGFAIFLAGTHVAEAATDCEFIDNPGRKTLTLRRHCRTDETLYIPDGYTLEGNNRQIRVVESRRGEAFSGPVLTNAGEWAGINQLRVSMRGNGKECHVGGVPLSAILLENASGFVRHSRVERVNRRNSACLEGYGIEVRSHPFDGTHPNTRQVEIAHNRVDNYQAAGIFVNGDVIVDILHNQIGSSANQSQLAATAIQLAHGAGGRILHNQIEGNSWCCESGAGSGILLYLAADGFEIRHNQIVGDGDVGIFILESNHGYITDNHLRKRRQSGFYDVGIENFGVGNVMDRNQIVGYSTPIWEII